ncbi:group 1 truncated hemoglobin [Catenovulum sp. SM1970]|nr:group 1 truncated hemoglobin [Marinifaba aquimaris]
MEQSLYERLGGSAGINQTASDLVDLHLVNPAFSARFKDSNPDSLKKAVATFFITGTGGPNFYQGKNMLEAHRGMNISSHEFLSAIDDAMQALSKNNIAQREQEEVLFALYSMKDEIVLV